MKRREEVERLTGMSDEELKDEAARLKESLFRLNFKLALGEVDAVKTVRREKKALARVQTLMRQRAGRQQQQQQAGAAK
jgi:ribosomal protein L29